MNKRILIKYGGNAMTNQSLLNQVASQISELRKDGIQVILVHGGGPFINAILEKVNLSSEFVDGHRKTSPEALKYIEMALKGEVNGMLVNALNKLNLNAVGLSGKDGPIVTAKKRLHRIIDKNGQETFRDLERVGDVESIDASLLEVLLEAGHLPVLTCLGSDKNGVDYNINADLFAGHLAGALKVDQLLILTNVDGLLENVNDPASKIHRLPLSKISELKEKVIKGGMIPKVESCRVALEKGAHLARIINGTQPNALTEAIYSENTIGTKICLQ